MDINLNMWYSNLEKTFVTRHILHQHWYTCPIALLVRRNRQHRSLLTVVSTTSVPPFQPLRHQRAKRLPVTCEPLYATNTSHRKQETFLCVYFALSPSAPPPKTHNRMLLFGSKLEHGRHFDYWNQPLNMCMRVCYLYCHEAGLCCYPVIHIEPEGGGSMFVRNFGWL
jgi:hypothetical protein